MIVIFCDTNKLWWVLKKYVNWHFSDDDFFVQLSKINKVYVNTIIVEELFYTHNRSNSPITKLQVHDFLKKIWCLIFSSRFPDDKYQIYVKDPNDAQILQDAVDVKANILLTYNTKDFLIDKISQHFGIFVTNHI